MKFLIGLIIGILAALTYTEDAHTTLLNYAQEQYAALASAVTSEQATEVIPEVFSSGYFEAENKPETEPLAEPVAEKRTSSYVSTIPFDPFPEPVGNTVPVVSEFQLAWMPFRSETSANGFAHKLSSQLDHEFEVIKSGPGHYEVGFRFEDVEERQAVLVAIENITGYRVPSS